MVQLRKIVQVGPSLAHTLNFFCGQISAYILNQLEPVDFPQSVTIANRKFSRQAIIDIVFLRPERFVMLLGFMTKRLNEINI